MTALIWIGISLLFVLGVAIGRLLTTTQQQIVHQRLERKRWTLYTWQTELERGDGGCERCRQ